MDNPRVAVVWRTHFWDDFAFRAAARVWDKSGGLDFYVEVNESESGPVDTGRFSRLVRTLDYYERLGLPCLAPAGRPVLWWNTDYGLYGAAEDLPDYDYYMLLEYDVGVTVGLRSLVDRVAAAKLDCVTVFDSVVMAENWAHAPSCAGIPYSRKSWTPLCIMLVSRRAALHLLAERRRCAILHAQGKLGGWPISAGFFSSALSDSGFTHASLRQFADLTNFHTEYVFLEGDTETRRPDSFTHSVLDAERFWKKFASRAFRTMLERGDAAQLRRNRDSLGRARYIEHEGWRILGSDRNLALDRPARQSSLSRWSRKGRPRDADPTAADAQGANCGVLNGSYGFHTDTEKQPWWAVDLQQSCLVDEVRIYNSTHNPERARRLIVEVSADGKSWREVFRKGDERVFAGNDDPLICTLEPAVAAKHLRVVLDGAAPLHLAEVEVYGSAVPAALAVSAPTLVPASALPAPSAQVGPRAAVLFRTHFWDDFARRAATRLEQQCAGMDFFIEINETDCGPVDVSPFHKVSNTVAGYEALGLPCVGDPPLWFNCDYGLYGAAMALPGYDYYFLIEYDVTVNLPLRPIVDRMAAEGIDCVTCFEPLAIGPAWSHAASCVGLPYSAKLWLPLCIMLATARTAQYLLSERQRLARMYAEGTLAAWPISEGFFASALADGGYQHATLKEFANLRHFRTEWVYLEGDPTTEIPGTFCHAVLDIERFWQKFINRTFRSLLGAGDYKRLRSIRDTLIERGEAEYGGWRVVHDDRNVALDRPARQSSLSDWSRRARPNLPDPNAIDARGANCGVLTGDYAFHTRFEDRPWWAVDLQRICVVDEIRIFNSRQSPERARRLSVELSRDGVRWQEVFRKTDDRVFFGIDNPLVCRLAPPVPAAQVRVVLDGHGALHLCEVEVYGQAA